MKLALATDRALIRASWHSTRHLAVSLIAPRAEGGAPRTPLDLALLLDRSGSMAGDKWPRTVAAARAAIARLRTGDRVAVVVYDDQVETVLPLCPAGPETRQRFDAAIAAVHPRGSTDLGAGWLTGCGLIGHPSETPRLRRCLLLTDGLANVGITGPAELAGHARELAEYREVQAIGIGAPFDVRRVEFGSSPGLTAPSKFRPRNNRLEFLIWAYGTTSAGSSQTTVFSVRPGRGSIPRAS